MDNSTLNQEVLEDIIKECNNILIKWSITKRKFLISENEVKGILFNRIKHFTGNWREQKALFKVLRVNIEDNQIKNITFITDYKYNYNTSIDLLNTLFNNIDFKSLQNDDTLELQETECFNINLNTIKNIIF